MSEAAEGGVREWIPAQRAVAIVYAVAMFMSIMDTQIVNVALPTLSRDFRTTTASVQWVVTAYIMSIAVSVPTSGWLGDRFGTKRIFLFAVGAFTLASLLCALSTSLPELVAVRVLQGIGGGMMVPVGMAMLYRAYPPARRVRVARTITRVTMLGPATAPIIGGTLVTWASWRWIFSINLPVGILIALFGARFLHEHREAPDDKSFDFRGAILVGAGLALLLYAIGSGPTSGWGSATVLVSGTVAIVAIGAFIYVELHRTFPVLDLRLLSNRLFRQCSIVLPFSSTAFFGTLVFTSLYLQEGRGLSPINSGLSTFPEAIAIGLSSQVVARIYPRVGPRRLMAAGFGGLAVTTLLLATTGFSTSLWVIRALTFCLGVSVSYIMLPTQASAFAQISSGKSGQASAIFNTLQRATSSIGVAVLSTVLAAAGGDVLHGRPPISAFHWVFITNTAMALCGVAAALRIHDGDAAAAMGARHKESEPATA